MQSPVFNSERAKDCTLYYVVANGFNYYFALEKNTNHLEVLALVSFTKTANKPDLPAWVSFDYDQEIIVEEPQEHLLVPSDLFSEDQAEGLLKLNSGIETEQAYRYEYISSISAYYVSFKKVPGSANTTTSALLAFAFMPNDKLNRLYIDFRFNHILITLIKQNELALCNTYTFEHRNDILYFITAVLQQHALTPNDVQTYYSGLLRSNSALMQLLKEYIPNAVVLRQPAQFKFHPHFKQVPLHFYFSGLIQIVCE
ncbi:MAG: DUF3822 family protein [Bacteroidetes bacterium]|nr:DUF3822 family protein [Bacteroidota bacterium]